MLTGAATSRINVCINSLLIEKERKPEVKIRKDGVKKQCAAHAKDKVAANLSVVSCVLMRNLNPL